MKAPSPNHWTTREFPGPEISLSAAVAVHFDAARGSVTCAVMEKRLHHVPPSCVPLTDSYTVHSLEAALGLVNCAEL